VKRLVVLTVAAITVLTGGLALYLFWVGTLLHRIAGNLEDSADLVRKIDGDAKVIRPGVAHINRVGGVVAGALPLLYGMAEQIVRGTAPPPTPGATEPGATEPGATEPGVTEPGVTEPGVTEPGTRRSRLHDGVGYNPPQ
jgi:hypothetical protein